MYGLALNLLRRSRLSHSIALVAPVALLSLALSPRAKLDGPAPGASKQDDVQSQPLAH
jgi:hypothetical protein